MVSVIATKDASVAMLVQVWFTVHFQKLSKFFIF